MSNKKYNKDDSSRMWDTEQLRLKDIVDKSTINEDGIRYKKLQYNTMQYRFDFLCDRMFVIYQSSYQSTWIVIKRLLSKGNHVGFDLVDAQPTLLQQVCIRYGDRTRPTLTMHIENRAQLFLDVQAHHHISRNQAKTLMMILIFGGDVSTWIHEGKIAIRKGSHPMKFVTDYHSELHAISTSMELSNKFPGYNDIFQVAMTRVGKKENLTRHITTMSSNQRYPHTYKKYNVRV